MDDEGCCEASCFTPKAWVPGQIKLLLGLVLLVFLALGILCRLQKKSDL
jgi:hypothetical protein